MADTKQEESNEKTKQEHKEDVQPKVEKKKKSRILAFFGFGGNAPHSSNSSNGTISNTTTVPKETSNGKPGLCGLNNLGSKNLNSLIIRYMFHELCITMFE